MNQWHSTMQILAFPQFVLNLYWNLDSFVYEIKPRYMYMFYVYYLVHFIVDKPCITSDNTTFLLRNKKQHVVFLSECGCYLIHQAFR